MRACACVRARARARVCVCVCVCVVGDGLYFVCVLSVLLGLLREMVRG